MASRPAPGSGPDPDPRADPDRAWPGPRRTRPTRRAARRRTSTWCRVADAYRGRACVRPAQADPGPQPAGPAAVPGARVLAGPLAHRRPRRPDRRRVDPALGHGLRRGRRGPGDDRPVHADRARADLRVPLLHAAHGRRPRGHRRPGHRGGRGTPGRRRPGEVGPARLDAGDHDGHRVPGRAGRQDRLDGRLPVPGGPRRVHRGRGGRADHRPDRQAHRHPVGRRQRAAGAVGLRHEPGRGEPGDPGGRAGADGRSSW